MVGVGEQQSEAEGKRERVKVCVGARFEFVFGHVCLARQYFLYHQECLLCV